MGLIKAAREVKLGRQLPDLVSELARLVDSGSTLHLAFEELATAYPPPLATELASVIRDLRNGVRFDAALLAWAQRSDREDIQFLVSACRIGAIQGGGNLVSLLEGLAAAMNDEWELIAEARSLTAQARASAWVMTALPFGGLLLFSVLDRSVVAYLFGTPTGRVLLIVGLTLNTLGAVAMSALVKWALR
ncbi:MAG: type II secretion system F family protein [Microthrixaceae bacterium]|nr:type II secretion system F family protein [Microthrixaceae bacterium]